MVSRNATATLMLVFLRSARDLLSASVRTSVLHVNDEVSPWDNHMSPNSLSNLTIVVVEDRDDARRYLGLFLDRLNATVVWTKNGFEGLEARKNSRPNLVASDIQITCRHRIFRCQVITRPPRKLSDMSLRRPCRRHPETRERFP